MISFRFVWLLYCNGGVALAKMLHTILSQRLKVTAVLVICCKMDMHKAVEVSSREQADLDVQGGAPYSLELSHTEGCFITTFTALGFS